MPSKTSKTKQKLSSVWRFQAIGTSWSIETANDLSTKTKNEVGECIEAFDQTYSRFRDDSTITQLSQTDGTFHLGDDSSRIAHFYRQLYEATSGAVTPLVGGGLVAAGYDKDYSLSPTAPSSVPDWDKVMTWVDSKIVIKEPIILDVGAAGKGYLVDKISTILEATGIVEYVIDASGDIKHKGSDTQTIGLENPFDTKKVVGTYPLHNASLCASASNRRRWGDGWHHILDGRTGEPTSDVVATWVVAGDTMIADGLATALFFVSADKLVNMADFQFVRLFAGGKIEHSKSFVGQLYV